MAKFHYYRDEKGEWRWRFRADGGKIIADSGEGYRNRDDCLHAIDVLIKEAPSAERVEERSKPT